MLPSSSRTCRHISDLLIFVGRRFLLPGHPGQLSVRPIIDVRHRVATVAIATVVKIYRLLLLLRLGGDFFLLLGFGGDGVILIIASRGGSLVLRGFGGGFLGRSGFFWCSRFFCGFGPLCARGWRGDGLANDGFARSGAREQRVYHGLFKHALI